MLLNNIYQAVMWLCAPLWKCLGLWRLYLKKENADKLPARFGIFSDVPRKIGPLVWFHGASVGEARSALSIIHKILKDWPSIQILLTTQTTSAILALTSSLPKQVTHQMTPYDSPVYVKRFLNYWRPQAFCVIEAELWPCLWTAIHNKKIPMYLFNFHISAGSFKKWTYFKSFFQQNYGFFEKRWTGDNGSYERFCKLTSLPMTLMPSIKYSVPVLSYCAEEKAILSASSRPMWFASCVHAEEEDLILRTHNQLRQEIPSLLLLYAPRHLERIPDFEKKTNGLILQKRSDALTPAPETDIYIINTMGELGLFYASCPFTVLCGSFMNIGGHNIIEPALLGCAVIYGPHMSNNQDISNDFQRHKAAMQIQRENLCETVLFMIRNPAQAQAMANRAMNWLLQARQEVDREIEAFSETLGNKLFKG